MTPSPPPATPGEPLAVAASLLAAPAAEEHLLVRVGTEWFGVPLADAEEALEAPELHQLRMGSSKCVGAVRWRGQHLPVHVATALGVAPAEPPAAVLLLGTSAAPVALAVDEIADVVTIAAERVRAIPGLRDPFAAVHGVTWIGDRLVTVMRTREVIASLGASAPQPQREVA